jgi:hypothetical protein
MTDAIAADQAKARQYYRPIKRSITIRLDADVIVWFKERAADGHYQTAINLALRERVDGSAGRATEMREEIRRLRAALRNIASYSPASTIQPVHIARDALAKSKSSA